MYMFLNISHDYRVENQAVISAKWVLVVLGSWLKCMHVLLPHIIQSIYT